MNKIFSTAKFWQFDEKSVFPFGKFKGKTVLQVFEEDPSYVTFCLCNIKKFVLPTLGWNALHKVNSTALLDNRIINALFSIA